jgi:hypothetical protein
MEARPWDTLNNKVFKKQVIEIPRGAERESRRKTTKIDEKTLKSTKIRRKKNNIDEKRNKKKTKNVKTSEQKKTIVEKQ